MLQTEIAHDGTNHRTLQIPGRMARSCQQIQQLVTIHHAPQMIHHHQSIRIAIQRNTHVCPHARYRVLQQLRRRGTAMKIDIPAIR